MTGQSSYLWLVAFLSGVLIFMAAIAVVNGKYFAIKRKKTKLGLIKVAGAGLKLNAVDTDAEGGGRPEPDTAEFPVVSSGAGGQPAEGGAADGVGADDDDDTFVVRDDENTEYEETIAVPLNMLDDAAEAVGGSTEAGSDDVNDADGVVDGSDGDAIDTVVGTDSAVARVDDAAAPEQASASSNSTPSSPSSAPTSSNNAPISPSNSALTSSGSTPSSPSSSTPTPPTNTPASPGNVSITTQVPPPIAASASSRATPAPIGSAPATPPSSSTPTPGTLAPPSSAPAPSSSAPMPTSPSSGSMPPPSRISMLRPSSSPTPPIKSILPVRRIPETVKMKERKVILAEDVEVNRELIEMYFDGSGVKFEFAVNGQEVCDKFAGSPGAYSLILMDIQMPIMDGYEATRKIRSMDVAWAKQIPIIAMTGNDAKEDIDLCFDAGMDDHVSKPIDMPVLQEKVFEIIASNTE